MVNFTDLAPVPLAVKANPRADNPVNAVIAAVIEALKANMPQNLTHIAAFPDKGKDFDMEGRDAACLVIYDGSSYDGGGSFAAHKRTLRLSVLLLSYALIRLDGEPMSDMTSLIECVRLTLDGGNFAGARQFRVKSDELLGETEDAVLFKALIHFEGSLPSVPLERLYS
jgi:Gp37 protein